MKKYINLAILVLLISTEINSQSNQFAPLKLNKDYFVSNQSRSSNRNDSNLAIDNDDNTSTILNNNTANNWWQLNMKFIRNVTGIRIKAKNLNNFHVFTSKSPINLIDLNSLLQDPWINYIHVDSISNDTLLLDGICQYIMIMSDDGAPFILDEVDVFGDPNDDPNNPFVGPPYIIGPPLLYPYGDCGPWWWPSNDPPFDPDFPEYVIGPPFVGPTGVNPWWSSWEICGDGIDNDDDGLKDCEDYPCGVGNYNIYKKDPSCPICENGVICIYCFFPVNKISIDNGITWKNITVPTGEFCFENLDEGTYTVVLQTPSGCQKYETVELRSPEGSAEVCENGGFETGTFNGWSGGLSTGYYPPEFDNNDFNINNRHTIITNPFVDPLVNYIGSGSGTYMVRLGNAFGNAHGERLNYCFTVDQTNMDFSFNYAVVLEDIMNHGHGPAFFQYRIYDRISGEDIVSPIITDSFDPHLDRLPNGMNALGWQCVNVDLSNYVNRMVCAEFITSDCIMHGHFAYAYIDGLCQENLNQQPIVNIKTNETWCANQPITVDIEGQLFNRYRWHISQIDVNNNEFGLFISDSELGFTANISNLKEYYESNSGLNISCPSKIRIKFEAFNNDCGTVIEGKDINIVCDSYEIEYCDPMLYCLSANQNQLQISGVNNCENCSYEWSSKNQGGLNGMLNRDSKFPILDKSIAFDVFEREFDVAITTPNGCIYEDSYSAIHNDYTIEVQNIEIGYCSYEVTGTITFHNYPTSNDLIQIIGHDVINNVNFTIPFNGDGAIKSFTFPVLRDVSTRIRISVNILTTECSTSCSKSLLLNQIDAPFHTQWKAYLTQIFSPNAPSPLDRVLTNKLHSVEEDMEECNDMNITNSSIYYYRLEVYDEWGSKFFDQEIDVSPLSAQGLIGNEIFWDGTFNNLPAQAGVYVQKVTIRSCYNGVDPCTDCNVNPSLQNYTYCGTSGETILTGDVTLQY